MKRRVRKKNRKFLVLSLIRELCEWPCICTWVLITILHYTPVLYVAIRLTNDLQFEYLVGVNHNECFILEHTSPPVSCKRKGNLSFVDSRTSSCMKII